MVSINCLRDITFQTFLCNLCVLSVFSICLLYRRYLLGYFLKIKQLVPIQGDEQGKIRGVSLKESYKRNTEYI